jgi:hypothetical protein
MPYFIPMRWLRRGPRRSRVRMYGVSVFLSVFALVLTPSLVGAELTAEGDLFVKFSGGIAPAELPRHRLAPIAIGIAGTVRTLSGDRPPALRKISIGLHRGGHLDTRGLPVCRKSQINPGSSAKALEVCESALIGEGRFTAKTAFPEQETYPAHGRILAFNSVRNGHPTILAHIYGADPVPITRVIVFRIHRHPGATFDTTLTGSLPVAVNRYGYVKRISLYLFRQFVYNGRVHSYLSAACAAPPGFPSAIFPFARASMTFEDDRTLSSSLTRTCRVL